MVWSFHSVKELKEKHRNGEEISIQEQRKLEKYIRRKKKTPNNREWKKKQLLKAERLLHDIKKENGREPVEVSA